MKEEITTFLEGKNLSDNSKTAYFYDLEQFVDVTHAKITETNLRIYQASIADFKPSVQKRKLSAVNQFLDLSDFYADTNQYNGRLIALLILEMGLLPSEILQLKVADVNLDFQIIRIEKAGQKRIVPIPDQLIGELETTLEGTYLLEKNGKSYSRQWGFRQLEAFLIEKNQATLSAQSLREQYILRQREKGVEIYEIARNLGLKTMMTLEKYR